jgi:hypothetical protein
MSIFGDEWIEFPHIDFAVGKITASDGLQAFRAVNLDRFGRTRLHSRLLGGELGRKCEWKRDCHP